MVTRNSRKKNYCAAVLLSTIPQPTGLRSDRFSAPMSRRCIRTAANYTRTYTWSMRYNMLNAALCAWQLGYTLGTMLRSGLRLPEAQTALQTMPRVRIRRKFYFRLSSSITATSWFVSLPLSSVFKWSTQHSYV